MGMSSNKKASTQDSEEAHKGGLVLVLSAQGNKQAGLRPSGTEAHEREMLVLVLSVQGNKQSGLRPFGTEARKKGGLSLPFRHKETSRWESIHLVRRH